MKKLLALLTLIVLLFSCTVVYADGTKELTFQGVHWFTSPDEAIKSLKSSGFVDSGATVSVQATAKDGSAFYSHIQAYKKDKKVPYSYNYKVNSALADGLQSQTLWSDKLCKTIAKQTIKNVSLLYTADTKNPQLVEVCIWFDKDDGYDMKAVYDALVSAFGKPNASRKSKEYVWLGNNNTIAVLYNNDVVFATLDGLTSIGSAPADIEDTGF